MTKAVRIENADNGTTFKVLVQHWDRGMDGQPDVLVREEELNYPTAMANGAYITDTRYIVVRELK